MTTSNNNLTPDGNYMSISQIFSSILDQATKVAVGGRDVLVFKNGTASVSLNFLSKDSKSVVSISLFIDNGGDKTQAQIYLDGILNSLKLD